MTNRRQSIYSDAYGHSNPVPAACRLGNLVMTGIINGLDPARPAEPGAIDAQCTLMFRRVVEIMTAAGGSTDDIIKLNVWVVDVADAAARDALNRAWVELFPDPASRPVRQTTQVALDRGKLIQCDVTAVIG